MRAREIAEVADLRQRFWAHGYRPLAVWGPDQRVDDQGVSLKNPGKQPRGRWRKNAGRDPPDAVTAEPDPRALNTGLACGDILGFDVDVLDQGLVDQIVSLIERRAGPTPLSRIGQPPKILLVYRPDHPFTKIQTPELFFPDGSKAKVELLANGQQFVADGIHPDTGQPFRWMNGSPADVPIEELPTVTENEARAIVELAEQILRAAGAKEKEKPEREPPKPNGGNGNFFAQVNAAALADIVAWVRLLFPSARFEPGTGAWRVSSKDLGRNLQEDLSIHPEGVQDFGEEVTLSAIDVVMRYGAGTATAVEAALWLCERLALDPASLGFHKPAGPQRVNPWIEPPPSDPEWPEIEVEAFHGLAGEIVDAIAPLTEADPVAILAQHLIAFGNAFGRNAYIWIQDTQHYPNIFGVVCGTSSKSRKGTSYDPVERLFRLAHQSWVENCIGNGLSSGEGLIHRLHDGLYERVKVSHRGALPTFDRVLKEPAVSDKRLIVIEQEFASVLAAIKRQGNTLSPVLRLAWDGKRLQTITKHSPETATGAHVSVVGHITVEEFRRLVDQVHIANGFANRFLLVLVRRSKLLPFPERLDEARAKYFAGKLHHLLTNMDWRRNAVEFTPEAREMYAAEYPTLPAEQPGLFGQLTAQAEAQVKRLAMIYALLDQTYAIAPAHLRAGLAFWRYCEASAKHIIGDAIGDPVADEILYALRPLGADGMTRAEIYRLFNSNKSSETIGNALNLLLRLGKVRRRSKSSAGQGRPTEVWSTA